MKIKSVKIHNYKSIIDETFVLKDYSLLVGPNNVGKTSVINALRAFYGELKFSEEDIPTKGSLDKESYVEVSYELTGDEFGSLKEEYKTRPNNILVLRRYLWHSEKCKSTQSNLYYVHVNGDVSSDLFYGWKSVGLSKLGNLIYVPTLSMPSDNLKTSGSSPFRDAVTKLIQEIMEKNQAYRNIIENFRVLTDSANGDSGFLSELTKPLNKSFEEWGIKMGVLFDPVSTDTLIKNHIRPIFTDDMAEYSGGLEKFGDGFQRNVIYKLISFNAYLGKSKQISVDKEVFSPELTLILFEEPEAFLHPEQQIQMSIDLRSISKEHSTQVLITTHSPMFVGKNTDDLSSIIRLHKNDGQTTFRQIIDDDLKSLFGECDSLYKKAIYIINDPSSKKHIKDAANKLIQRTTDSEDIRIIEEMFRYQVWLDSDRSSIFFADKILIVEGASEKVLFQYLSEHDWKVLRDNKVCILNTLGKYNVHRYMILLDKLGINFGVVVDRDSEFSAEIANAVIQDVSKICTNIISPPMFLDNDLESFLSIEKISGRDDLKPIKILQQLSEGKIPKEKLEALYSGILSLLKLSTKTEYDIKRVA